MAQSEAKISKLTSKLRLKDFKLNSLLEITKAINNNQPVEKLVEIYEYILREQLGITRLILFNNENTWQCLLRYGVRGQMRNIDVEKDLVHIKEITVIESSSKKHLNSFDVVIPVFHKDNPLAYLLIGDLDEDEIKISPTIKHMPFIQTLTNIIVVAIENKRMARETLHQERVKRELEVASELQMLLFPKDLPRNNRVEIAAHYLPHNEVGGDYYDFYQLNPDEFVFCVADVSGKGISAALLMSNFQANLRALLNYTSYTLYDIVEELNKRVMDSAKGEKFITFFIAKYNIPERKLLYINCGHNPPVLSDGRSTRMLEIGCTGLGMFDALPSIKEEVINVTPNSVLACFTDGLVELENNEGEQFGESRLNKILLENHDVSMDDLNKMIFSMLDEYREDQTYVDDTALFSTRFL